MDDLGIRRKNVDYDVNFWIYLCDFYYKLLREKKAKKKRSVLASIVIGLTERIMLWEYKYY